jgi:hypothetical protein
MSKIILKYDGIKIQTINNNNLTIFLIAVNNLVNSEPDSSPSNPFLAFPTSFLSFLAFPTSPSADFFQNFTKFHFYLTKVVSNKTSTSTIFGCG